MDRLEEVGRDNESIIRSLPELSRETGIPMPTILRLKREHPGEVPSFGTGSQQSFPAGVAATIVRLYTEESEEAPPPEPRRVLFSIPRRRMKAQERPVKESKPTPTTPPPPAVPQQVALASPPSLADRLMQLEEEQKELTDLVSQALADLRRAIRAEVSLI